jgi:chorismate mutase
MTPESIEDWRRRIDAIDRQLLELFNERARCAIEIGRLKRAVGLPVYQPDREKDVLNNAERANSGPLDDTAIRRLFERVIDEARSLETREALQERQAAPKIKS